MAETTKSNTKQAVWIAIGNLFSTGIALVSAMILSRYFNKEDYGTYKQVIYIYGTTQIVFTLGLPRCFSYFLPKLPIEQAKQTINKISNIFYVTGLIFAALLFFSAPILATGFNNTNLTDAIRIYSPVAFFLLPTLGLEGILATYQKSEYIALYNTLTRVFMLICVVVPVIVFGGSYKMALWGFVISSFITYLLAIYLRNLPLKGVVHQPTTVHYRDIWNFSLPLMTASIWGALINSTDQFFISRYYGTEEFANFSNGAAQLPFVGMIMTATVTVLTPVFSREFHKGNFSEIVDLWQRSTIKAAKLLFPLLIFFIVFAQPLMIVMYGKQYAGSAIFFQIKQVAAFTQVITVWTLIISMGHTKFYSQIHMWAMLALIPIEYTICKFLDSAFLVTVGHVIVMFFMCTATFFHIVRYLNTSIRLFIPFKQLITLTLLSTITAFTSFLLFKALTPTLNNFLLLLLGFTVFLVLYIIGVLIFKVDYNNIFSAFIPSKLLHKYPNIADSKTKYN